jgi:hypothetical protein
LLLAGLGAALVVPALAAADIADANAATGANIASITPPIPDGSFVTNQPYVASIPSVANVPVTTVAQVPTQIPAVGNAAYVTQLYHQAVTTGPYVTPPMPAGLGYGGLGYGGLGYGGLGYGLGLGAGLGTLGFGGLGINGFGMGFNTLGLGGLGTFDTLGIL